MNKLIVHAIIWVILYVASTHPTHADDLPTLVCDSTEANVWGCIFSIVQPTHPIYRWTDNPTTLGTFDDPDADTPWERTFRCNPLKDKKLPGGQPIRDHLPGEILATWVGPVRESGATAEVGCISPGIGIEDTGHVFMGCHDGEYCALWRVAVTATGATSPSQYRYQYRASSGASWTFKTVTTSNVYMPHLGQNDLEWRVRGENALGYGVWAEFTTTGECGGPGGPGGPGGIDGGGATEALEELGLTLEDVAH